MFIAEQAERIKADAQKFASAAATLRAMAIKPDGKKRVPENVFEVLQTTSNLAIECAAMLMLMNSTMARQRQSLVAASVRSNHFKDNTEPLHAPAAAITAKRKTPAKTKAAVAAAAAATEGSEPATRRRAVAAPPAANTIGKKPTRRRGTTTLAADTKQRKRKAAAVSFKPLPVGPHDTVNYSEG